MFLLEQGFHGLIDLELGVLVKIEIDYESYDFPSRYALNGTCLITSWHEFLWAGLTVGRPNLLYVFKHGNSSFYEAIFRLSLLRMAVETGSVPYLRRTAAYTSLDPTEKGMISYFLGNTLCKLYSARFLDAPWLLHLDVFRSSLNPTLLGRSRPDMVGEDSSGNWLAFEVKGRSSPPSKADMLKAKQQASRLVSVGGTNCSLNVATFAYFKSDELKFRWQDPETNLIDSIALPDPSVFWRHYYEPALSIAVVADSVELNSIRESMDLMVVIHPKIKVLLQEKAWQQAKKLAIELKDLLAEEGYMPDGLKVTAGETWASNRVCSNSDL